MLCVRLVEHMPPPPPTHTHGHVGRQLNVCMCVCVCDSVCVIIPGRGGGHSLYQPYYLCAAQKGLCEAKLHRQGSLFHRFSLDMGNKFRKSPILSCDNSLMDSFATYIVEIPNI